MKLTGDNLEYAISQYLDGTLSELDRRVLDEQLATDADARRVLEEYRKLNDTIVAGSKLDLPVRFDRFAAHISTQLEHEEIPALTPTVLPWVTTFTRRIAIAAALVLGVGIGVHFISRTANNPTESGTLIVAGPAPEQTKSISSINIAIGPTDALRERGMTMSLADDSLIAPSPRVVISAADKPAASSDDRLY